MIYHIFHIHHLIISSSSSTTFLLLQYCCTLYAVRTVRYTVHGISYEHTADDALFIHFGPETLTHSSYTHIE